MRKSWRRFVILRHRDQLVIGSATLFLGLLLAGFFFREGGLRGQLVDLDDHPIRPVVFQLDINQAQWAELAVLSGIGEIRARRIVGLREQLGQFSTHQELMKVKGIGPKTLERMKPYLLPIAPNARGGALIVGGVTEP